MQKIFRSCGNFTVIFLGVLLGACASERPVAVTPVTPVLSGDLMLRESEGIAQLSNRWKSGKQLVDKGNLKVREGQAQVDEGNRLVDEGTKIMRESEESYKNIKK